MEAVEVPSGVSVFPHDIIRLSERWARNRFTDLRYYRAVDKGGHFAAFEQPALFTEEVRAFFRTVR
jgi:pimeloyl-ACP methyl ester carboxylesterase